MLGRMMAAARAQGGGDDEFNMSGKKGGVEAPFVPSTGLTTEGVAYALPTIQWHGSTQAEHIPSDV